MKDESVGEVLTNWESRNIATPQSKNQNKRKSMSDLLDERKSEIYDDVEFNNIYPLFYYDV